MNTCVKDIYFHDYSGLGAGGSPAVGAQAATESRDEITEMVKDADLVFVTAGIISCMLQSDSTPSPYFCNCKRKLHVCM